MSTPMTLIAVRGPLLLPARVRHLGLLIAFAVVNLVHPLVHGTPIDGGTWDGLVSMLNAHASSALPCEDHESHDHR